MPAPLVEDRARQVACDVDGLIVNKEDVATLAVSLHGLMLPALRSQDFR